jgi:hypothetical protein
MANDRKDITTPEVEKLMAAALKPVTLARCLITCSVSPRQGCHPDSTPYMEKLLLVHSHMLRLEILAQAQRSPNSRKA